MSGNAIRIKNKMSCLLILGMFLISSLIAGINILPFADSNNGEDYALILASGPVSTIISPVNNSEYTSISSIYGSAHITGGGNNTSVVKVEITIKRLSDNRYWDGWSWNVTKYWLTTSGTWSWSYNTGSVSWTNQVSYLVQSRATDGFSRVETPGYGNRFTTNASKPITTISSPSPSYAGKYLNSITGTAYSLISNTITKVELQIIQESDNYYWNGSSWINISQPWLMANGTSSWSYNSTSVAWTSSPYLIRARATDNQSNIGSIKWIRIFIDNVPPTSRVTHPLNNSFIKILTQISVIATESNFTSNYSQVKGVELLIKRLIDNYYWDGSGWVVTQTWVNMNIGNNYTHWVYNARSILWTNNTQYLARSKATDYFNNVETPSYGTVFNFTQDTFYSTIIQPQNNSWKNNLDEIKGYTYFNQSNINITKVEMLIKRTSDSFCWDGVKWDINQTWLLANGSSHWNYNSTQVQWTTGIRYHVRSCAYDNKSHVESPSYGNNFRMDLDIPTSNINYPVNNSVHQHLYIVHGNAYDTGSGVYNIQITIKRLTDNKTWSGSSWVNTSVWINVYQSGYYNQSNWYFNLSNMTNINWTNGTRYLIRSRAIDRANNIETPSYGVVIKISYNMKPSSSISYPWNNSLMYYFNKITGSAQASTNRNVNKVEITIKRLSDNKYWDGLDWNSTKVWLTATGTTNWYYYYNFSWNLGSYHIQSRATDNASVMEQPKYGTVFTVIVYIVTVINIPKDNSTISSLDSISGITWVAYNNSVINKVEIKIKRLSDNQFWTGSSWGNVTTWLLASGTSSWSYNSSLITWTNNTNYLVSSRATDNQNNTDHQSPINRFTIIVGGGGPPSTGPTSYITSPVNNSNIDPPISIYGTASVTGNRTVSKVDIQIIRTGDNHVWTGSTWATNTTVWLTTSGTTSWSYNTTSISWTNGSQYRVQSRATDSNQTVETPGFGNIFTIKSGSSQPANLTSNITTPTNNSKLKGLNTISGTASISINNTTVSKVEIMITYNNQTWNGVNWTSAKTWLTTTGTTSWSIYVGSISFIIGRWYRVQSRATDSNSIVETPSYGVLFLIDNKAPSSSISIPVHNSNSAAISVIRGGASDPGNSGVQFVDISVQRVDTGLFWSGSSWVNWTVWLRTNGRYSWQYTLGGNTTIWTYNKTYCIRSRATDAANNVETPSSGNLWTYRIVAQKPYSYITDPTNNSYLKSLSQIIGRAYSNQNYSTITKIEVSIKRLSDSFYWSGSAWVNSLKWLAATKTPNSTTWWYNTGLVSWSSSTNYRLQSRVTDNRSQVEVPAYGVKFMIDNLYPSSTIIQPTNNSVLNSLNYINGTAADTGGSGLVLVEIELKRLSDNKYWDGYKWNNSQNWVWALFKANWKYYTTNETWTNNTQYQVRSRATDLATNQEIPSTGHKFTIKFGSGSTKKPTSNITQPTNNSVLKSLSFIRGTAVDNSGSGLKKVEITLKNINKSKYWTGSTWSATETWLTTIHYPYNTNFMWVFNTTSVTWSTAYYWIQSKATDNNSNVEIPSTGKFFVIDNTKPSSTIKVPTNNLWLKALKYINGTSSDSSSSRTSTRSARSISSGIKRVEISIYRVVNKRYWSGSNWVESETWLTAEGTFIWYYDCSNVKWHTHNKYIIRSRAIDNAGNMELPGTGNEFIYDNVPPKGLSISIENGRKLKNIPFVKVKLGFEDTLTIPLSSGTTRSGEPVYEMSFSFDGITWTPWETFSDSKIIELTKGDGEKTVYFRLKDPAGNIAEPVSDTIIIDTTPPTSLSITINNDDKYTSSRNVNLELGAFDALAGLNNISHSHDGFIWSDWEEFKTSIEIEIPPGDGQKTVYFRVSDLANNIAESVYDSIILDTQAPTLSNIQINNGAEKTDTFSVNLTLFANDKLSGLGEMSFSTDGLVWTDWEEFSYTRGYNLSSTEGKKTIYFKVKDKAGNIAEVVFASIIYEKSTSKHTGTDSDGDGIIDELDAFPDDPAASKDSDSDGYPDSWNIGKTEFDSTTNLWLDRFPTDPAASVDSDLDGYPDFWNPGATELDSVLGLKLDAYPNDPNRYQKGSIKDDNNWTIIIIIIIFVVVLIVLFSIIVLKSGQQRHKVNRAIPADKILQDLKDNILNDKLSDNSDLTSEQLMIRLNNSYKNGEISMEVYWVIKNLIE